MIKHLDLFSGIGGFALALDWAADNVDHTFCEIDPFCQKVLNKHWPNSIIHDDIKTFKANNIGRVDILTGGFPCQPFSSAGKQRAQEDDRHLWPEMFRVIKECRPSWIVGENVTGIIELGLEQVCLDLESEGYEVWPLIIPACAVNAPHRRDRVWIIANTNSQRLSWGEDGSHTKEGGSKKQPKGCYKPNWRSEKWPSFISRFIRVDDGVSRKLDFDNKANRLKALGNAIVPQVAYEIFKQLTP